MEAASGRGRLRSPPCKVLAEQLRLGARRGGQPAAWLLDRPGGQRPPLDVSVVWMQGTVLEVRPEHNTSLQLLDETGSFTVVGVAGVPQGRPCTSRGQLPHPGDLVNYAHNLLWQTFKEEEEVQLQHSGKYVMVMGMVQSCRPEPVVRAVKVTDLSGNPLHRSMWKLEVEDLQQYMS